MSFTLGILAVLGGGNREMYDGALRAGIGDLCILTDTSDNRGLVHYKQFQKRHHYHNVRMGQCSDKLFEMKEKESKVCSWLYPVFNRVVDNHSLDATRYPYREYGWHR